MAKRTRKTSVIAIPQAGTNTRQTSARSSLTNAHQDERSLELGSANNDVTTLDHPRKKAKISDNDVSILPQLREEKLKEKEDYTFNLPPDILHDILYEILGHCHPKDLISLSRTNRQFRNILLANSAVWRRARERLDGPDCPSYTSEREWAILLFVKVCEICGADDTRVIDFYIRRRLCFSCKKKNLISTSQFHEHFPGISEATMDIVPYTNDLYPSFNIRLYVGDSVRYYLLQDIKAQMSRLDHYERRAKSSRTSVQADSLLNAFKEYHKAKIRVMHLTARSYLSWQHTAFLTCQDADI